MKHWILNLSAILAISSTCTAQILIDSIPIPGINQSFWGIQVSEDTIFLGADNSGDVYFSDHSGTILGHQSTGYSFNHGLIRHPDSYLIAQDYTGNGAHLYEVSLAGSPLNTWSFPDVIGGHSSGIGDLCVDGNAVWYTMYYPDFTNYPFAYAYKWLPGDAAPTDTVPLHGEQPYGIALKGDTLFYVTDNLHGDPERIYSYNLTTKHDIGFVDLPDPDGDQSPRGMYYDGTYLYLVAQRIGGSAFAYQTVYIYSFEQGVGIGERELSNNVQARPNPVDELAVIEIKHRGRGKVMLEVFNSTGAKVFNEIVVEGRRTINTSTWRNGLYVLRTTASDGTIHTGRLVVRH
ncbi:MAG: T9SS type A sorting domain-containing protein [Flavobacteriales bacterium]